MKRNITYSTYFGYVYCNLKELMDKKNISINLMSKLADIKYDVVKRYYTGEIYHVDLQILAKFCYILECDIQKILNYEYEKSIEKQGIN